MARKTFDELPGSGVPCQKLTAHIYPWKNRAKLPQKEGHANQYFQPLIFRGELLVSGYVSKNIVDKFTIDKLNFMKPKFDRKHCELHIKHIQKQCFGWDGSLGICLLKPTDLSRRGVSGSWVSHNEWCDFQCREGGSVKKARCLAKDQVYIGDSK